MKKLIDALKRSPRRAAGLAVLVSAVAIPAGLLAWGPDRPTYTLEQPADHVTFNSITNNQKHRDERNFVQIREVGGKYGENVSIEPGKTYEVYSFYHNNYKNHNETEAERMNGPGVARNTMMRVQMPRVAKKGEKARISAEISADNAKPNKVWDEAYGVATSDVALRYVQGSAKITNEGSTNGMKMPDSLFTTGAPLGFNKLDGNLPGCNEFSGYVTFKFTAVQPNFEIQKTVAKHGDKNFVENLQTKVGDIVDYKIQYKNTGQIQQDNVVIQDQLPKGLEYVKGSTLVATTATGGQWKNISDDTVTTDGINIGSYAPNGNAYVKFSAKVTEEAQGQMVNIAKAKTDNGTKDDEAVVTVEKQPKVAYTCKAMAASQLSRNKFKFDVGYSAVNATYKKVVYVIKDENGKVVEKLNGNPKAVEYEFAKAGKYTVEAQVVFVVNDKEVVAGTEKCTKNIEVKPEQPKKVKACEVESSKIVELDEDKVNSDDGKYTTDLSKCDKKVKACEIDNQKIVTVNEKDIDDTKYTKDLSKCDKKPEKVDVCEVETGKIVKVTEEDLNKDKDSKYSKDTSKCDKKIDVCRKDDKTIVKIDEKDFNKDKYTKNISDCEKMIKVCRTSDNTIVKIKEKDFDSNVYTKDTASCEVTPITPSNPSSDLPTSLPETGAAKSIMTIAGAGLVTLLIGYAVAGRKLN